MVGGDEAIRQCLSVRLLNAMVARLIKIGGRGK